MTRRSPLSTSMIDAAMRKPHARTGLDNGLTDAFVDALQDVDGVDVDRPDILALIEADGDEASRMLAMVCGDLGLFDDDLIDAMLDTLPDGAPVEG